MSDKDLIVEELRHIQNQLKRQERTAQLRFRLAVASTYIVMFLSVGLASLSLGKGKELVWIVLIPFLCALLTGYWACLKYRQNYHKKLAISGSILVAVGVETLAILLISYPVIICPIQIAAYCLVALLIALGIILMVLALWLAKKK